MPLFTQSTNSISLNWRREEKRGEGNVDCVKGNSCIFPGGECGNGVKVGQEVNELYELVNITPVFQWKLALSWWCSGVVACLVFMSLASLMDDVKRNKRKAQCIYSYQ